MPVLSVITVTYQRHHLLGRKADSLRAQRIGPGLFEWCVAANGDEAAAALLAKLETPFSLRLVSLAENRSIAAARNAAAALATGQLLLLSDDDVLLPPGCLAAHLEAHGYDAVSGGKVDAGARLPTGSRPGAGAPPLDAARPRVVIGDLRLPAELRPEVAGRRSEREPFERVASVGDRALWINATGANTSLARVDFEEAGGYDPAFAAYGGEDSDLALRLRALGAEFVRGKAAWAEHFGLVTVDVDKAFAAGRAAVRVWRKHGGLAVGLMLGVHPGLLALKRVMLSTPLKALFGNRTGGYEDAYRRGAAVELATTARPPPAAASRATGEKERP